MQREGTNEHKYYNIKISDHNRKTKENEQLTDFFSEHLLYINFNLEPKDYLEQTLQNYLELVH